MISMLPVMLLLLLTLMVRRGGKALVVVVVRLGDLDNRRGPEPCLERKVRLEEARARVESLGAQTLEAAVMTMARESTKCRNE